MRNKLFKLTFILALVALAGFAFAPSGTTQAASVNVLINFDSGPNYQNCSNWFNASSYLSATQTVASTPHKVVNKCEMWASQFIAITVDGGYATAFSFQQQTYGATEVTVTINGSEVFVVSGATTWTYPGSSQINTVRFDTGASGGTVIDEVAFTVEVAPPDADNDGIEDGLDNCPNDSNNDQADMDNDNIGDACDMFNDNDNDGIENTVDNCPANSNNDQADVDNDGIGDVCDGFNDNDSDTVENTVDNCPDTANPFQEDVDNDGIGDACDGLNDNDGDGIANASDNCIATYNPDQIDADEDGRGDVCDPFQNTDGRLNWQLGDINAVLYPAQDDAGNPAMQVYCTTADATGFLAMMISQVDLPEVAPAENTLIASADVCNVEFWALAEGSEFRYQVNVGPNADGTVTELLFNGVDGADIEMRNFNLYDLGD